MNKRKDTTIAINPERNSKLKDAVVEIITSTREPIKTSNIVHYLIDNYLDEAIKDIKEKE